MGLRISTNLASIASQRVLSKNQEEGSKSMTRLASGDRITSAADDAAGLSISERLRGQIKSVQQAQRNANDGISFVQVAEGSLGEVSNSLIRMRELAIQASSDTVSDRERGFIDQEIQQLKIEIDRIADSTNFNGTQLLNGESEKDALEFQVGAFNRPSDRINYKVSEFNVKTDNIGIDDTNVTEIDSARDALGQVDAALDKINGYRASLGAMQNRLHSTSNSLGIANESLSAANSRIRDTDIAAESAELVKRNILNSASVAVLAQANQVPAQALRLL
ncbi:MAG: flagellin FliC [Deltaproteobacteria bacterium]|nr:flagellin FliC [Deltaproteobacteria bacterium]